MLFLVFLLLRCAAKDFNVEDYGAVPDGKTDSTKFIQAAFDAMTKAGESGSVALFPSGKYVFGPVVLENINNGAIQFKDSTLIGLADKSKWAQTGDSKSPYVPWITVQKCNSFDISGGLFNGRGDYWWKVVPDYEENNIRPFLMQLKSITNLTCHGLTLTNSPHTHLKSANVKQAEYYDLVLNTTEKSNNTDGIMFANSQYIHVHDVWVRNGDDSIKFNDDTHDVLAENSFLSGGHGCSIGGASAKLTIKNVMFRNMQLEDMTFGGRIKITKKTKGVIANVTWQNFTMAAVERPMAIDVGYHSISHGIYRSSSKPNIVIDNINFLQITAKDKVNNAKHQWREGHGGGGPIKQPGEFICADYAPCPTVHLKDIAIDTTKAWECKDMSLDNPEKVKPTLPSSCV